MRWLLLVGLLAGCGQFKEVTGYAPPYDNDLFDVLPEFEPFVQIFEDEAKDRDVRVDIRPITIKWANLGENVLGMCTIQSDKEPLVEIDKEKWLTMRDCDREELINHELGHCILRRDHNNDWLDSGIVASIMYPNHIGCKTYVENRDYYLDELFSRRNEIGLGLYEQQQFQRRSLNSL